MDVNLTIERAGSSVAVMTTSSEDPKTEESRDGLFSQLTLTDPVAPKEFKVWSFALLWRLSEITGFRHIKLLINLMFVELAPSIPVSLRHSITGVAGPQAGILGATITLIFCLLVPIGWTLAIGKFSSAQPGTIFLWQDKINLILYAVVCPLYVGLGCWLAVVAISGWSNINEYAMALNPQAGKPSRVRLFKRLLLAMLVLSMGLFSTASYIGDILNPVNVPQHYWFMDIADSGEHTLGPLGVYYFLINFVLLMTTLISITLFMSVFVSVMAVGQALEAKTQPSDAEFAVLEAKLATFTEAYILAKSLTFVYMINYYMWKSSPLGATQNIYLAFIFLTLFGVLFVSLPRYFVELQWYRFLVRTKQVRADEDVYKDLRPFKIRVIATLLDNLMIGGFVIGMLVELISRGISH